MCAENGPSLEGASARSYRTRKTELPEITQIEIDVVALFYFHPPPRRFRRASFSNDYRRT